MSIVILDKGKKFSQEFLKYLFLAYFYSIYVLMTFFFVDEGFLSNYADDTALYSIQ